MTIFHPLIQNLVVSCQLENWMLARKLVVYPETIDWWLNQNVGEHFNLPFFTNYDAYRKYITIYPLDRSIRDKVRELVKEEYNLIKQKV